MAQEASDSITLAEITIKADRVSRTSDGLKIYPTKQQLEASANGYGLIARLSLPQIKVNEAIRTIEANEMVGSVEVRINGITATQQDLMSLDMKWVRSIHYIERPGLVYGTDVGRVINIITRRADRGYAIGGQLTQALTTPFTQSNIYTRLNRGKHEISLSYSLNTANWNNGHSQESTRYILNDNSINNVVRDSRTIRDKRFNHNISLKYNIAETERYTMQIAFAGYINNSPAYDAIRKEHNDDALTNTIDIHSKAKDITPQADFYLQYMLPHKQTITANAVGTYANRTYRYRYGSTQTYAYQSNGDQYNINAEARYQKQWTNANLTFGGKYSLVSSTDNYTGSISTTNKLSRTQYDIYAQMSGTLWNVLNYQVALGFDGLAYTQNDKRYNYRQIIPKLSINYNPSQHWQIGYSLEMQQRAPRLAIINDITSMRNEMEYNVGNPNIKPSKRHEHTLSAYYQGKRLQSSLTAMYRANIDTWMDDISRSEDNIFTNKKQNKGDVNMIYISNQTTLQIIPENFDMTLNASFIRCFSIADTYTHSYSAWMGGASVNAYMGKWSFTAGIDNGWRSMEGETVIRQGAGNYITISRQLGKWGSIRMAWQNILDNEYQSEQIWLKNKNLQKHLITYNDNLGNMLFATLSINLSKGRRYKSPAKTMNNTGIEHSTVTAK